MQSHLDPRRTIATWNTKWVQVTVVKELISPEITLPWIYGKFDGREMWCIWYVRASVRERVCVCVCVWQSGCNSLALGMLRKATHTHTHTHPHVIHTHPPTHTHTNTHTHTQTQEHILKTTPTPLCSFCTTWASPSWWGPLKCHSWVEISPLSPDRKRILSLFWRDIFSRFEPCALAEAASLCSLKWAARDRASRSVNQDYYRPRGRGRLPHPELLRRLEQDRAMRDDPSTA